METEVSKAAALAAAHIQRAGSPNASAAQRCIAYLEAAEAAIDGLETEYDQLLIEAKFCDITSQKEREELDRRIDRYLDLDILRPQLQKAKSGLESCLDEIREAYAPEVGKRLADTLEELAGYLDRLEQSGLHYRRAGTGVAVRPLREIQENLRDEKHLTAEGRKLLRSKAEKFQRDAGKDGLLERTEKIRQTIESLRRALVNPSFDAVKGAQTPLIFISHCHADEDIARALIDLLQVAISLGPDDIRATSVPGYKLRAGARVADELQKEIAKVEVVLGLVTSRVSGSPYVLFELGAAWGLGKPIYPLITPGIEPNRILGPIASVHRINLKNSLDCHQLVDDLGRAIKRTRATGKGELIADKVQRLVQQVPGAHLEAAFQISVLQKHDPQDAMQEFRNQHEGERVLAANDRKALEALLDAKIETLFYLDRLGRGDEDRAQEERLARLWSIAARAFVDDNPSLARLLNTKSDSWARPRGWDDDRVKAASITIDEICKIAEELLGRNPRG